jgi:hypothetical protein
MMIFYLFSKCSYIYKLQATLKDDSATTNRRLKSQPHILAHLVLPDTQADPSQNQKS